MQPVTGDIVRILTESSLWSVDGGTREVTGHPMLGLVVGRCDDIKFFYVFLRSGVWVVHHTDVQRLNETR